MHPLRTSSRAGLLAAALSISITAVGSLSAADAKENWAHYCVRCHGADGTGNTKMGRKLNIKDLTSAKTQSKMSDEQIADMIKQGNQDEDKDGMPAFAEKLSVEERQALAEFVRGLKKE